MSQREDASKGSREAARKLLVAQINSMEGVLVSLVAVLIGKSQGMLMLEDSTGRITVRIFAHDYYSFGDVLLIIGRKVPNGCIIADMVRNVDKLWLNVRKLELSNHSTGVVLEKISKIDTGIGVEIENLLACGLTRESIDALIQQGDVYEVEPGRIKVLE